VIPLVGVASVVVAFVISALATSLSKQVALRLGMMDVPGRHKTHSEPVPMLGGSAIFLTILGMSLLGMALVRYWAATETPEWIPEELAIYVSGAASKAPMGLGILTGALILHVVGLIDDRKNLPAAFKLIAQALVATGVVFLCDVRILTAAGGAISVILSVLWLVAIINAFNFMDNMDGLAGGVAVIVGVGLLGGSASMGQVFVPAMLCVILGSLAGFMPCNFPPASVYMGDAGSLVIGYLLGVLSCLTTYAGPGQTYYAYGIFVPVVLMAVPLYDMLSVVALRIRDRRNPMVGDRRHFSHRLIRRGMSVRKAVLTIYLCTAGTAVGAVLLSRVDTLRAMLIFAQTVVILMVLALLETADGKA